MKKIDNEYDALVAIIYDEDNRDAVENMQRFAQETKSYDNICREIGQELSRMGVGVHMVSQDADWSKYKVMIAPMMYLLHEGIGVKVKDFVAKGGSFLATYFTGYVNNGQQYYQGEIPGDGLSEVFGIIREKLEMFNPPKRNGIIWSNGARIRTEVKDFAEVLLVQDADVLATFEDDYYAGKAAITQKRYGEGYAYYVAGRIEACDLWGFFENVLSEVGIKISYPEECV